MKPPKILVVEDEFIVAFDLAETVKDEGFALQGPFATVESARKCIAGDRPDCALLDVQLAGGEVYELADQLTRDGIPVVFHSGHAKSRDLVERYPGAAALEKPCPPAELIATLRESVEKAQIAA